MKAGACAWVAAMHAKMHAAAAAAAALKRIGRLTADVLRREHTNNAALFTT